MTYLLYDGRIVTVNQLTGARRPAPGNGMTLLEVIIAMVIVSIGVLTVLQSQAETHRLVARTQSHERLAVFAEGIMEKVIASKQIPPDGRMKGSVQPPNEDVTWTAEIKRNSKPDTSALVRIDLTVISRDGVMSLSTERYWP